MTIPTQPKDGNIFLYNQILSVHKIETVGQTFQAKFYLKATWVQSINLDTIVPAEVKPGYVYDLSKNWPEYVYKPKLDFDNAAAEIIELKDQSLEVSDWRGVQASDNGDSTYNTSTNITTSSGDSRKELVMEWSGSACGTFTYQINLNNYPYDIQMLKMTIGTKDPKVSLKDDWTDGVQSTIRKDHVLDLGFKFLDVDDFLFKEVITPIDKDLAGKCRGAVLAAVEETFVISPYTRRKIDDDRDKMEVNPRNDSPLATNGRRKQFNGNQRTSFRMTNQKDEYSTLSYIVLVERIGRHSIEEIAIPISLISLSSFASFIFGPAQSAERLAVSITIFLVMTSYAYLVTTYVPKMHKRTLYTSHLLISFVLVFAVVFQNALFSLIHCRGYCEDSDMNIEFENIQSAWLWDLIFTAILLLAWSVWNVRLYIEVYSRSTIFEGLLKKIFEESLREVEEKRVRKELEPFKIQEITPTSRVKPATIVLSTTNNN